MLLTEPSGEPLAKHVTQKFGLDSASFVLQSATDDTLQFVADCLAELPGDFAAEVLPSSG